MADAGFEMVRYADDFVILCRSAEEAISRAGDSCNAGRRQRGSVCIPRKPISWTCSSRAALTSSGITSSNGHRVPRTKSLQKLKDAVRQKTRRTNGQSLAVTIADVNRTLVGWFAYFKHSNGSFEDLDAWIRTRLRSILRKRAGLPWPPALRGPCVLAGSLLCGAGAVFSRHTPMRRFVSPGAGDSSTGEPDAGDSHVRFGGRGE